MSDETMIALWVTKEELVALRVLVGDTPNHSPPGTLWRALDTVWRKLALSPDDYEAVSLDNEFQRDYGEWVRVSNARFLAACGVTANTEN